MRVIILLNNDEKEEIDNVDEIDGLNWENSYIPIESERIEIYSRSWEAKRVLPKSLIKELKIYDL